MTWWEIQVAHSTLDLYASCEVFSLVTRIKSWQKTYTDFSSTCIFFFTWKYRSSPHWKNCLILRYSFQFTLMHTIPVRTFKLKTRYSNHSKYVTSCSVFNAVPVKKTTWFLYHFVRKRIRLLVTVCDCYVLNILQVKNAIFFSLCLSSHYWW